jgi:hypothetical protein
VEFSNLTSTGLIVFIASMITATLILIGPVITFMIRRSIRNRRKNQAKLEVQTAAWEIAMSKWKRLYYCHTDGIVFDPEIGAQFDPPNTAEYLFSGARPNF